MIFGFRIYEDTPSPNNMQIQTQKLNSTLFFRHQKTYFNTLLRNTKTLQNRTLASSGRLSTQISLQHSRKRVFSWFF